MVSTMRRIDLTDGALTRTKLLDALPRAALGTTAATQAVVPIIARVKDEGAPVLYELAERFDHVRPERLRVPAEALIRALEQLDPQVCEALETSVEHNRIGHTQQPPIPSQTQIIPGGAVEQRWLPVGRVGLYVPGGLVVYPSSVVVSAVCAQVVKAGSIVLASSPQAELGGLPHPVIFAACALLGVDEVWATDGTQTTAALSYGITDGEDILQPADVVTGPSNIYVAAVKRLVQGTVGTDAEAGTTEIAILADETATPEFVAADFINQAEHDPAAVFVLVTISAALAEAVDVIVPTQACATTHTKRILTALSGPQSGIVIVDTLDEVLEVVNAYAAEHLEIHTANASQVARRVTNAGATFVGLYAPVPLGDYIVGFNHVLPIGGTVRFASGLNVTQYLRSQQVAGYTVEALAQPIPQLDILAREENLPARGQAAFARARGGTSQ